MREHGFSHMDVRARAVRCRHAMHKRHATCIYYTACMHCPPEKRKKKASSLISSSAEWHWWKSNSGIFFQYCIIFSRTHPLIIKLSALFRFFIYIVLQKFSWISWNSSFVTILSWVHTFLELGHTNGEIGGRGQKCRPIDAQTRSLQMLGDQSDSEGMNIEHTIALLGVLTQKFINWQLLSRSHLVVEMVWV